VFKSVLLVVSIASASVGYGVWRAEAPRPVDDNQWARDRARRTAGPEWQQMAATVKQLAADNRIDLVAVEQRGMAEKAADFRRTGDLHDIADIRDMADLIPHDVPRDIDALLAAHQEPASY
jgi:hypothetical protein